MSYHWEEVEDYCIDLITSELCNFNTLKKKISQHFNGITLKGDDESSIKEVFIATALKMWQNKCEVSIEKKVSELKNDKDELVALRACLSHLKSFDDVPDLIRNEYYGVIKADRELFGEENLLSVYTKVVNVAMLKVKEIQDVFKSENEFLFSLIDFVRKSGPLYERVVEKLRLLDFVERKIEFHGIIKLICESDFKIESFDKLQRLSTVLDGNFDVSLCETIRSELHSYIIMDEQVIEEDGRKILLLMRKVISINDVENFAHGFNDVRVVCDVFNVYGKKEIFKFKNDNLIIMANIIRVHDKITIDLSGKDADEVKGHVFRSGTKDGIDGNAGESGGNIAVSCDKIENGDWLTLKSNGGNGSMGQAGKDGIDGENGEDVQKCNMTFRGEPYEIKRSAELINELENHIREAERTGERSGPIVPVAKGAHVPKNVQHGVLYTVESDVSVKLEYYEEPGTYDDDGFGNDFFNGCNKSRLLVYGKSGTEGTEGGLGGLGGEGGFAGRIDLEIVDDDGKPIKVIASKGSAGLDGLGGYNGINGKDGRDAWAFQKEEWNEPKYFGLGSDEKNKYEIVPVSKESEFAMWSLRRNMYIGVGLKSAVNESNTIRERIKSAAIRSRASHAKTTRKKATFRSGLKNQYSEYLNHIFQQNDFTNDDLNIELDLLKEATKKQEKIKVKKSFSDSKLSAKVKKEETIYTYEEVKEKVQIGMKFHEFVDLMRKSCLTMDQWQTIKEKIISNDDAGANDFQEAREDRFDSFFLHALNTKNIDEQSLNADDILMLIDEKILIAHVPQLLDLKFPAKYPDVKIGLTLAELIPYLKDKKSFDDNIRCENKSLIDLGIDFATMNHYFNSDLEHNRHQITDLFTTLRNKYLDKHISLTKRVMKAIASDKSNKQMLEDFFNGIANVLRNYKREIKDLESIFDLIFLKKQNVSYDNIQVSTKEIITNEEMFKFIVRNLLEEGIRSPIYQGIVSFLFNKNVRLFIRNIDGSLCLINESMTKDGSDMFLIMERGKFSELFVDFSLRQRNELKIKEAEEFYYNASELTRQNLIDEKSLKVQQAAFLIQQMQNPVKCPLNLIDTVLSFFSENYDRIQLKSALLELPHNFLLYIYVHFFFEGVQISIKEFSTIIFTVSENPKLFDYLSVKFITTHHTKWIIEVILLQIEKVLNEKINDNDSKKFKDYLNSVSYRPINLLFLLKLELSKKISRDDLEKVLKNMRHFSQSTYNHLLNIQELNSWQHVITSEYWLGKFKFLTDVESPIVNELQSKFDDENLEKLLSIINEKSDKFKGLSIVDFLKNFNTGEWIFSNEQFKILEENDPKDWIKMINEAYTSEGERSVDQIVNLIKQNKDTSESIRKNIEAVADATRHVLIEELKNNSKLKLRNTQILSILSFLMSEKGALLQIGTGEGKTFVGATFALLKALDGKKIHIVTSSSVLAERDASDPEIKRIFRNFNVSIGHNCHDDMDERRRVYMECGVVYGTLANFQRDYLLTVFYDKNILPSEYLQNVLVDEVDSILLDKGNNILYLSKELPDVDELESAFVFIWQWVNQEIEDEEQMNFVLKSENIRQAFLDNFLGLVFESDLKAMIDNSKDNSKEVMDWMNEEEIIDDEGVILKHDFSLAKLDASEELKSKLSFYIRKKIEAPKVIKVPKFYHKFVLRYLNRWIKSALNAIMMQEGVQYVIDKVSGGPTVQSEPNIIILDVDTGADQKNSEWDEGLCQFLQLKHGCRLSELSLKSVFISNVSYFKLYEMKYGMTGTLGTKDERDKLKDFYDLEYATIPSYLPKKFTEFDAILTKSDSEWLAQIVLETTKMVNKNRSVLIICNTIRDIDAVENAFFNSDKKLFNETLFTYKRDYEDFNLGSLLPKKVIIATNLAGRGTDIRLSKELANSGGLHVILTYLAPNVRIENQAYGRAARAGAKGSARMIIQTQTSLTVKGLKHERDEIEFIRLDEVSNFYQKFITNEEKFFKAFLDAYKIYTNDLSNSSIELREILLENIKVLWALWLDESSELLNEYESNKSEIEESFKDFLERCTKIDPFEVELHPTLRVEVLKYFIRLKDFEGALKILNEKECEGSIGYEYNKILIMLNDKKGKFGPDEVSQIRRAISLLKELSESRTDRSNMIRILKDRYRCTLKPVKGYENQLKELNEVNEILIDSLVSILGKGITPESFDGGPFSNFVYKESFYNFLVNEGYVGKPMIDMFIKESDVHKIAERNKVNGSILYEILTSKPSIDSFDELATELKQKLNFPSRENFWDILLYEGILINEAQIALVDKETFKEISPCVAEEFLNEFKPQEYNIEAITNREILLSDIPESLQASAFVCDMKLTSNELFKTLDQNNLVNYNRKAIFNKDRFDKIKSEFKFDKFDSVSEKDFEFITPVGVRNRVIARLKEQEILDSNLNLIYQNMFHLDLEENFIYEEQVEELLRFTFQYRIALENLLENISEKLSNISIKLCSNPHVQIIHDLIEEQIILPSITSREKLDQFKKVELFEDVISRDCWLQYLKSNLNSDLILPKDTNYESLLKELLDKQVLLELTNDNLKQFCDDQHEDLKMWSAKLKTLKIKPVVVYKLDNTLSPRYKSIENPVKLVLRRRHKYASSKDEIHKALQNSLPKFDSKKTPVLVPINSLAVPLHSDALECTKLKGLDCVIGVEEKKYTWKFWLSLFVISIFCVAQISISMVLFKYQLYSLSMAFFAGAIDDMVFIFKSINRGTFSWHEYYKHKSAILRFVWKYVMSRAVKAIKRKMKEGKKQKTKHNIQHSSRVGLKASRQKTLTSARTAHIAAHSSKGSYHNVLTAVESLRKNATKIWSTTFKDKFLNHAFYEDTIDKLLAQLDLDDSFKVVIESLCKINQDRDYHKMFIKMLSEKVRDILKARVQAKNIKDLAFDEALTGAPISTLNQCIAALLNDINQNVEEEAEKAKIQCISVFQIQEHDRNVFKEKVLSKISEIMLEMLEEKIECSIRIPIIKMIANRFEDDIAKLFSVDTKQDQPNDNYSKLSIAKNLESIEVKSEDISGTEFSHILLKKSSQIRKNTANIETLCGLVYPKCQLEIIELEAAARKLNIKLLIQVDEIPHEFGSDGDIINIDAKEGYFPLDSDGRPVITYENLFAALKSKMPMEITQVKFRNEIKDALMQDSTLKNHFYKQRGSFFREMGFYGIKEYFNLSTLRGSQKFRDFKVSVPIRKRETFTFKPNQDLRLFNKNGLAKTVDTHQAFNKVRAEGINATLKKINEFMAERFSIQNIALDDFAVVRAVYIISKQNRWMLMPVDICLISEGGIFNVRLFFVMHRCEENDTEIPQINAQISYADYDGKEKTIFFKTLLPALSNKVENELIPVVNSQSQYIVDRTQFPPIYALIDHTKIFTKHFWNLRFVTAAENEENLPDDKNFQYIASFPQYFCSLKNMEYFVKKNREKIVASQFEYRRPTPYYNYNPNYY